MSGPSPAALPAGLQAWRAEGRSFDAAGQRVFFRDSGTSGKPALILIHGFPTASWDWHALWDDLVRDFRLIAPDLIGFGFSAKPRIHRYSIFEQAAMIEALSTHLGIAEAHLLAHDYGDTVAQELLARHEGRIAGRDPGLCLRSIVLLNGGLFPETHRPLRIQRLLAGPLGPLLGRLVTRANFGRSFSGIFAPQLRPSAAQLDEFWALLKHDDGHRIGHLLIQYIAERREHRERWVAPLIASRLPRRLVAGMLDPISGAHMIERYRELVPAADVVALPDVGHYPQVEAPARVLAACREFWRRLGMV